MLKSFTPRRWAFIIAAAYVVLALAYGLANPPFEATDELRHFRYIRHIALKGGLPPVSAEASAQLQAHHPPLYYALAALLSAPIQSEAGPDYAPPINPFWGFRYYEPSFDNKAQYLHSPVDRWPFASGTTLILFIGRWVSTLFGLGAAAAAYRLGRTLAPNQPAIALGAMAFTAFSPTLLHAASSVNNDAAVACFGAWVIAECAAIARDGLTRGRALRLGALLGLAILSKVSAMAPAVLAVGVLWVDLRRKGVTDDRRGVIGDWVLGSGACFAISGWWFARNYMLSGDLMGFGDYQSAWVGEADRARLIREAISGLPYAWTTLWGRFGYGQVVLPDPAYWLWGVVCVAGAAGLLRAWRQWREWWTPVAALGLALAGWAALMVTIPATAHARHVLYAYPAFGVLLAIGLTQLFAKRRVVVSLIVSMGSLLFALYALFGWLAPAFAYPRTVAQLPPEAVALKADFEGVAELTGYTLSAASIEPGQRLDVTVYWKPLAQTAQPLQVFVHLVDSQGIIAAQRDTYPGLGNALTTSWRVGELFADTYRVFTPDTAYGPESLSVRVGLWSGSESRPLLAGGADSARLGIVELTPHPGDLPNPLSITFDDQLTLIGYDVDRRVLRAGETFTLQTYFRPAGRLDSDYWAYAHVVGGDGRIWALADSVILPFTSGWNPDAVNGETRLIGLAADTPPGQYVLEFGLSRVENDVQYRLPIIEAGRPVGDHVDLARLRVEP